MDDFDKQLIIVMAVAILICEPLYFILKKRYKKQGRSTKYLIYKICFAIGLPIVTIPVLLTGVIPFWGKVMTVALGCIVGYLYLASITSARKSFRKILGLPPEDEDTGEVIKGDEKKK